MSLPLGFFGMKADVPETTASHLGRCGLDVLFTLCSQYEPRVSHNEQFALGIEVLEGLSKLEAFFGV